MGGIKKPIDVSTPMKKLEVIEEYLKRKVDNQDGWGDEGEERPEQCLLLLAEIKEILEIYGLIGWKDFGYANGWSKDPDEIKRCKELKHETTESSNDPPFRRHNWTVKCYVCKIIYHYDSS